MVGGQVREVNGTRLCSNLERKVEVSWEVWSNVSSDAHFILFFIFFISWRLITLQYCRILFYFFHLFLLVGG